MSNTPCPHDAAVTRVARTNAWTAELQAHLDACSDCRLSVAVLEQLAALAMTTTTAAPPPRSPHVLWLRAEYARRARARSRQVHTQLATSIATPVLALIGYTLVRGTGGWAHLGQLSAQVAMAAALGLAITVWVMLAGRMQSQGA